MSDETVYSVDQENLDEYLAEKKREEPLVDFICGIVTAIDFAEEAIDKTRRLWHTNRDGNSNERN